MKMKTHESGTDTTENYTFRNLRDMINPIVKKGKWDVDNKRSKGTQLSSDTAISKPKFLDF